MSTSLSLKRKIPLEGQKSDEPSANLPKIKEKTKELENPHHKNEVFDAFLRLKSERKLCNFVIKIENEEIHVHRAVLISSSKYYEAMLTHDTAEKQNGRVEIHSVELKAGKQCIDFMYTGEVAFSLENPENLIYAAELMQLPSLTDTYFEFLREKLSVGNCLQYVQLAETFNRRSFAGFFKRFSADNFAEIIASEDFTKMSHTLADQCFKAVSDGRIDLETLKWEAMIKWVKADVASRKDAFPNLFQQIKLENLPEEFIREHISKEKLVRESSQCLKKAFEALCSKNQFSGILSFPIINYHSESNLLRHYNLKTKQWSRLARIPADMFRCYKDFVSRKGEVFVGTGDTLIKYSGQKWTKLLQTTKSESCYCRCVASEHSIYMVTKSFVIEYDGESGKIEQIEANLGFESFDVAASNEYLYAIITDGSAKEFSFKTKTWMPIAKIYCWSGYSRSRGLFYHGKLFAFGTQTQKAQFYEPTTDSWNALPESYRCPTQSKAFVVDDLVYFVGYEYEREIAVTEFKVPSADELEKCIKTKFEGTLSCTASEV